MRKLPLLFAAAVIATCAPALGQTRADLVALSEQRFKDAERLFDQKKTDEACEAFAESQRLDPKLGTLLNVAYCHETLGRTASAWREYTEAAAWAAEQGRADRERFAFEHASALAKLLSRIEISIPGDAALEIDGIAYPAAHATAFVFVDPGSHRLRVSAPGRVPFELEITAPTGAWQKSVHMPPLVEAVTKPPAPAPPPRPKPPPPPPDDTKPILGVGLATVGGIGLVVGGVFGALALVASVDASDHCTKNQCDATGSARIDDAKSYGIVTAIAASVGVVGVTTGGLLYFTSKPTGPEKTGARITPMLGAGVGGVSLRGAF